MGKQGGGAVSPKVIGWKILGKVLCKQLKWGSSEKDLARLKIKRINECDGAPSTISVLFSLTRESTEASPNYRPSQRAHAALGFIDE